MDDDKLLQRFPSPDGKRWFELRQQSAAVLFQEFSELLAPFRSTAPVVRLARL